MVDRTHGSNSTVPIDLLSKLTNHQIYAKEFFCQDLLEDIRDAYRPDNLAIFYFDREGKFLSLRSTDGLLLDGQNNPYSMFTGLDVVRHTVHRDAVHDSLTYFNTTPRLYKSTDIIAGFCYDEAPYTSFIERQFGAHYSVTLAFGINAYIQLVFYKTQENGDFTEEEMNRLEQLYIYLASAYCTFKKYEQSNIVSEIMAEIIQMGERAFFIADNYSHILSCNEQAENYLDELLGTQAIECINPEQTCTWLPFLLSPRENPNKQSSHINIIKDYIFNVRIYDRTYSNGIVDRYYWATISKQNDQSEKNPHEPDRLSFFTRSEQRVAILLDSGLTYQEIADELVISFHTVKKHVQSIYKKCGVKNRLQFSRWLEHIED